MDEDESRRKFLKRAFGAAGAGALAFGPASALDVRGSGFRFNDGFSVGSSGDVSSEEFNGVKIADSPDEVNEKFSELPSYGGKVVLRPGLYGDDDWNDPIRFPLSGNYSLDMTGVKINLDSTSFGEPYIQRPKPSGYNPGTIFLRGPEVFDVANVTDPDIGVQLWDVTNSMIWMPHMGGEFDVGIDKRSTQASGHMNIFNAFMWRPDIGYRVGKDGDGQTADRSWYFGQINKFRDYGIRIEKGKNNEFFVQPENTRIDSNGDALGEGIGYSVPNYENNQNTSNEIRLCHRGPAVPFDIENSSTRINLVGGMSYKGWTKSKIGTSRIEATRFATYEHESDLKWHKLYDKSGSFKFHSYHSLGFLAGTQSGEETFLETPAQVSTWNRAVGIRANINPINMSKSRVRIGAYFDEDNMVMIQGDNTGESNYMAKVVVNGDRKALVDTGVPVGEKGRDFHIWSGGPSATFYIDDKEVAHVETDLTRAKSGQKARIELETVETASQQQKINLKALRITAFR